MDHDAAHASTWRDEILWLLGSKAESYRHRPALSIYESGYWRSMSYGVVASKADSHTRSIGIVERASELESA